MAGSACHPVTDRSIHSQTSHSHNGSASMFHFGLRTLLVVASVVWWSTSTAALAQDRLALVVGVSDYPPPFLTPLPSSVNDAQSIHDFLLDHGYSEAAIDLQKNPTRRELLGTLQATLRRARNLRATRSRRLEQFVFFYSGHGTTVEDGSGGDVRDEGDEDRSDEAIVLLPEKSQQPRSIHELLIRDDQLFTFLQQMSRETRQLIVLFDACHSGGLFRDATQPSRYPTKSLTEANLRKYLTAIKADTDGLRDASQLRARDVVRERAAMPKELEQIECDFLFMAASAAHEEAAAGDPRSQFTDRLMAALVFRQSQVLDDLNVTSLTIENLDTFLTQKLADVRQTPITFARGIDQRSRVLGELFPVPAIGPEQAVGNQSVVRALTWRLLAVQDNQRPQRIPPKQVLEQDQRFVLQIEPTQDRYLYVLFTDPDFAPEVLLPDAGLGESEYLLPARFSVIVPRDGALRLTGPPGVERLRVVLSNEPLDVQAVTELTPMELQAVADASSLQEVAVDKLVQVEANGDAMIYCQGPQQPNVLTFDIVVQHR